MFQFSFLISSARGLAKLSPGSRLFVVLMAMQTVAISGCNDGLTDETPSVTASPKPLQPSPDAVRASPQVLEERFEEKAADAAAAAAETEGESETPLTDREVKELRRQFKKKLSQEREALKADQKRIRRDSAASRKQRKKDWNLQEREARRKFFEANLHGPERRAYVQEFIVRRKAFQTMLKDEEKSQKNELDARRRSFEQDQAARSREFEDHLRRKVRPPERLWNP